MEHRLYSSAKYNTARSSTEEPASCKQRTPTLQHLDSIGERFQQCARTQQPAANHQLAARPLLSSLITPAPPPESLLSGCGWLRLRAPRLPALPPPPHRLVVSTAPAPAADEATRIGTGRPGAVGRQVRNLPVMSSTDFRRSTGARGSP